MYYIMNSNISKISEVMEDIKQDITDNQYKIIMESLMAINKDPIIYKNNKSNEFIDLLEWLDTNLILSDCCHDFLKKVLVILIFWFILSGKCTVHKNIL